jgi:hypothetical protein
MDVRETTRDNAHLRRRGFVDMRRWAYARVPVGTDETSECPRIRVVDRRIHRDLQIPMCCLPKSRTNEKVRISTIVFQKRARKHVMRKRETRFAEYDRHRGFRRRLHGAGCEMLVGHS